VTGFPTGQLRHREDSACPEVSTRFYPLCSPALGSVQSVAVQCCSWQICWEGWTDGPDASLCLTAVTPCLQSTFELSEIVSHLGVGDWARRSQTVSVGLRCGQVWWSGVCPGTKNGVKSELTRVSPPRNRVGHHSSMTALTLVLSIWGASLSTVLGVVTLVDRHRLRRRQVSLRALVVHRGLEDGTDERRLHLEATNLSEQAVSLKHWFIEDGSGRLLAGSPYEGA
jgi:hypothetical protein